MDKEQKTLKSPLSVKFCTECMAKVAGEAQKSLARELYSLIEDAIMRTRRAQENQIADEARLIEIKHFLHNFIKKPE